MYFDKTVQKWKPKSRSGLTHRAVVGRAQAPWAPALTRPLDTDISFHFCLVSEEHSWVYFSSIHTSGFLRSIPHVLSEYSTVTFVHPIVTQYTVFMQPIKARISWHALRSQYMIEHSGLLSKPLSLWESSAENIPCMTLNTLAVT